ncbi:hypothetical protein [Catenulispora rubra]|uniref:hypothetical protein n=1 Tax=Catenulispora rubra TaxID=280293 RepID=UPI0018926F97|nr:hypothetical protein [Catenulispora rubra]
MPRLDPAGEDELMWTTLGVHAAILAVIAVIGGLVIRYFPAIVAVTTKDPQRRRAALEVLRLRRRDAAKIPTYLVPDDAPVVKPSRRKALPRSKAPDT